MIIEYEKCAITGVFVYQLRVRIKKNKKRLVLSHQTEEIPAFES